MSDPTIPIFPLPLVVLPGEPLPLHVFEGRYKALIQDCLKLSASGQFAEFGVVYYQDGMSTVGCTVRICSVLKEYSDGRMEVMTQGQRRFRILSSVTQKAYDEASVCWMEDDHPDWDESLATHVLSSHREVLKWMAGSEPADEFYNGQASLSFLLAQSSGLSFSAKQKILETTLENERLNLLRDHYQTFLPMVKTVESAQKSIHNNWALKQFLTQQKKASEKTVDPD